MTQPEREIVTEAISHASVAELRDLSVGFKENMNALYEIVFGMEDRETAFSILRLFCQHTGDVLRCVDLLLGKNKYHFHTLTPPAALLTLFITDAFFPSSPKSWQII